MSTDTPSLTARQRARGERTCSGCKERVFLNFREGERVWDLVLVLQSNTTACYPGGRMIEDPGPHTPEDPPVCEIGTQLAALTGRNVKLTLEGDPSYGLTLRWGTLRAVRGTVAVIDGYHDSSGVHGRYPGYRPDGVEVEFWEIVAVSEA
jgi:hypothetical protein